jgi:hypothetical protein
MAIRMPGQQPPPPPPEDLTGSRKPVTSEALAARANEITSQQSKAGPRPKFDLLTLLAGSKLHIGKYKSETSSVTVHKFPGDLIMALDTIRCQVPKRPAPARNLAINFCIDGMLGGFHGLDDLLSLEKQRRRFMAGQARINDVQTGEFVTEVLGRFPLSVPGSLMRPQQVNVVMPKETGNTIIERSNTLAIDKADMIVMCCYKAMSTQPDCNPEHKKRAEDAWSMFITRARLMYGWYANACDQLGIPALEV